MRQPSYDLTATLSVHQADSEVAGLHCRGELEPKAERHPSWEAPWRYSLAANAASR